jgi:hypothetical protein
MRRKFLALITAATATTLLAGCMSPKGDTASDKRAEARNMRSETLAKLYAAEPGAKAQIAKAKGYAVFSNVGVNVILLSGGSGWGIARDNATGRDSYMKMASAGIGLGLGVKDFRGVFVFTSRGAMESFIESGWEAPRPMPPPRPPTRATPGPARSTWRLASSSIRSPRAAWPSRPRSRAPSTGRTTS